MIKQIISWWAKVQKVRQIEILREKHGVNQQKAVANSLVDFILNDAKSSPEYFPRLVYYLSFDSFGVDFFRNNIIETFLDTRFFIKENSIERPPSIITTYLSIRSGLRWEYTEYEKYNSATEKKLVLVDSPENLKILGKEVGVEDIFFRQLFEEKLTLLDLFEYLTDLRTIKSV